MELDALVVEENTGLLILRDAARIFYRYVATLGLLNCSIYIYRVNNPPQVYPGLHHLHLPIFETTTLSSSIIMAWGIFETRSRQQVAGTVLLSESNDDHTVFHNVKTTKHRGKTIILVPQPSDDQNDPLNWPLWVRDLVALLYGYCTLLIVGGYVFS